MKSDSLPRVQVQINKNAAVDAVGLENLMQMIIDGTEMDIGLIEQDKNTTQTLDGVDNGILFKRSNSSMTVLFSSGVSIDVSPSNVSVQVQVPLFLLIHL